jgi:hypothetical protein
MIYVCMGMPYFEIRMCLHLCSVGRHFELNFGNAGKPGGGLEALGPSHNVHSIVPKLQQQ